MMQKTFNRIARKGGIVLLSVLSFSQILSSCKDREDTVGVEYIVAPGDLKVLSFESPNTPVDFTKDSAHFDVAFNHKVSWTLTLTGLESGAVKKFSGTSDSINIDNLKWGGNHDELHFFRANEKVEASVSFLKSNVVAKDTFQIAKPKVYKGLLLFNGFEVKPQAKYLITSLDVPKNVNVLTFLENGSTPKWNMDTVNNVEGKVSYGIFGADDDKSFFVGGVRVYYANKNKFYFDFGSTDPSQVYFNFYVYGDGNTNTRLSIACAEDDNGDGIYVDASPDVLKEFKAAGNVSEDVWEYATKINWTGWKLVSVKYSDFTTSASHDYGGSGNKVKQLDVVKKISLNVLSDPPGNFAKYNVDFPIVTVGKPFDSKE